MTDWHISAPLMEAYLASRLEPALLMSVDAHLARCGHCQALVPVDDRWLQTEWTRFARAVVATRPTLLERLLRRCHVPDHLARLLAATPTLSRAWLSAVAIVLGFACGAARVWSADPLPLLALAPVLPLAGIATAYGPRVDPAHELLHATPMAGARLLLVRSAAVLLAAIALTGVVTPLAGLAPGASVAWLLPSLALTTAALALATRLPIHLAVAAVGTVWLVAVAAAAARETTRFLPFEPTAQIFYGCVTATLALFLCLRLSGETT